MRLRSRRARDNGGWVAPDRRENGSRSAAQKAWIPGSYQP